MLEPSNDNELPAIPEKCLFTLDEVGFLGFAGFRLL